MGVQSMYTWLKKDWHKTDTARTAPQWVSFDTFDSNEGMSAQLTLAIGVVSIQIEEGFNPTLLGKVLQVLQTHVKRALLIYDQHTSAIS